MLLRILASVILLLSMLFMPFWVSVILAFAGMAYFSFFLEAVFIFLVADFLYATPSPSLFDMVYVCFGIALTCFILLETLKKKLRFHSRYK
ncbi:hypothetical protein A2738_01555 [Candidatus Nomurabacteria bacterium RIFCSPHIGHO2_01_FULL_42_15]|uniref:Uncharacterized protein n=1 Tax=Candidatus Nomurabacteria bacterium RIFCSPHIGHO2_01_FULL_42_15 TaxID=1801742 RepID=A0A1F6VG57_9BACT|nr:MAG: hypothetical protein A2738_01555 [Candidatus Nomurabacteria bacterium RIFCSPHIGHO2_01_FULL_42_15]OGI93028.1 MAG: hypothetical protein A3A99_00615 [Candidatus Nomurabacteria bacterium RIFCSPLOWO2_01_FULL_41_18]